MSQMLIFGLTAVALFSLGLYGLILHRQPMRKVLALNLMSNGVFLLLIALARRGEGTTDPLSHAMVLTGIVVSFSTTAFALVLIRRLRDNE